MRPVSSDTTTAMASLLCDMPSAARWRRPRSLGMSWLWDTGSMHPAARMRFLAMIMAPSCSGEFLKKMFSMSLWLMLASIRSPVSTMSSSLTVRSMTMSAPTLPLAMSMHAITMGMMVCLSAPVSFEPLPEKKNRVTIWKRRCVPSV